MSSSHYTIGLTDSGPDSVPMSILFLPFAFNITEGGDSAIVSLQNPRGVSYSESYATMLASEQVLARDWNTPDEDEAWANI